MPRGQFDGLRLDLVDGERVHVYGRPELFEAKRRAEAARALDRALRARRPPRRARAAEARSSRPRACSQPSASAPLPRLPRRIGLVTGNDAAAKRDVLTAIRARFPPAHVARRRDVRPGPARRGRHRRGAARRSAAAGVDVVVVARGGGSFEDLLPFSDERLVRAIAACPVPVVSAVGHEQDTPLCDLAADVRASTPSGRGAARRPRPGRAARSGSTALARGARAAARRARSSASGAARPRARAARAARRARCSSGAARGSSTRRRGCGRCRRSATLERGYAIVAPRRRARPLGGRRSRAATRVAVERRRRLVRRRVST